MKNKSKGDVHWMIPKKKRPIAYSTKATSDLIILLSNDYTTIQKVHDAINYDQDAKDILQKYIDAGYGDQVASIFFK